MTLCSAQQQQHPINLYLNKKQTTMLCVITMPTMAKVCVLWLPSLQFFSRREMCQTLPFSWLHTIVIIQHVFSITSSWTRHSGSADMLQKIRNTNTIMMLWYYVYNCLSTLPFFTLSCDCLCAKWWCKNVLGYLPSFFSSKTTIVKQNWLLTTITQ